MKKIGFLFLLFFAFAISVLEVKAVCGDNIIDSRDNKIYSTVQIGSKCWLRSDLAYTQNVADIKEVNGYVYYTWHDVMNNSTQTGAQGLCPNGWHIATSAEWVEAANVVSNNSCNEMGDAFGSIYSLSAGAGLRDILNINKFGEFVKVYGGSYSFSFTNSVNYWASDAPSDLSGLLIKMALISNPTSYSLPNFFSTDVYYYNSDAVHNNYRLARCVQGAGSADPAYSVQCYVDNDYDGYGSGSIQTINNAHVCPSGYSAQAGDCNDNNGEIRPGIAESCSNNVDDNCNGQINEGCVTESANCPYSFTDQRDNNVYRAVQIGSKCWMKDDLLFQTGVDNVQTNNNKKYYTWHDAMANNSSAGARGICPVGWHIPTSAEWVEAAETVSNSTCQIIDDVWQTTFCTTAGQYLKSDLDINVFRYGQKSGPNILWQNAAKYWSSSYATDDNNIDYIQFAYMMNLTNSEYNNYFYTDIVRRSWDSDTGYLYFPLRCVKDYSSSNNTESGNDNSSDNAKKTCYYDNDGDRYGVATRTTTVNVNLACPNRYVETSGDCNDSNSKIKPGITEVCGNNVDDNCNGQIDEDCKTCYYDNDKDSYGLLSKTIKVNINLSCPNKYVSASGDCNDNNARIKPGAVEICGNNVDDDCDGQKDEDCKICYYDADRDSYGVASRKVTVSPAALCATGYSDKTGDCNNSNKNIKPGAIEICGNNVDDNCDGQKDEGCKICYYDWDRDGYGITTRTKAVAITAACPASSSEIPGDCNDSNSKIKPDIAEICGNKKDDNCNGQIDEGC